MKAKAGNDKTSSASPKSKSNDQIIKVLIGITVIVALCCCGVGIYNIYIDRGLLSLFTNANVTEDNHPSDTSLPTVTATSIIVTTPTDTPTPNERIVGRWEQVAGVGGIGSLIEFYRDGTVEISYEYGVISEWVGEYSWPDENHIKMSFYGVDSIYEFELMGDEIILDENRGDSGAILRRYTEHTLSFENLAGIWYVAGDVWFRQPFSDTDNRCFEQLGLSYIPRIVQFKEDGTFIYEDWTGEVGDEVEEFSMRGSYSTDEQYVYISASGSFAHEGQVQEYFQGDFVCEAMLYQTRLIFRDEEGLEVLYLRRE